MEDPEKRQGASLWIAFSGTLLCFLIQLVLQIRNINQPLFEGYIGRQIPTAMVARDLVRNQSFFFPQLQTGPFPNYFLVEPPVYAALVAILHTITGQGLESSGRLISLLGMILSSAAVWLLTRRCIGPSWGWIAALIFLSFPVSIRYGRALQPDSFAIGLTFLGIALSTESEKTAIRLFGFILSALGIAAKVTLFPLYLIVPLWNQQLRHKSEFATWQLLKPLFLLFPAALWYGWVFFLKFGTKGQAIGQSEDGFSQWFRMIGPLGMLDSGALQEIVTNSLLRAYSPFATVILLFVVFKLRNQHSIRGLFLVNLLWLCVVGAKAHHGYYWLVPAPSVAILLTLGLHEISGYRPLVGLIPVVLCLLGLFQSRNTWQTPPEWQPLLNIPESIRNPLMRDPESPVVSHEAVIYAVNHIGLRWEYPIKAQQRAASVWGVKLAGESPAELLQLYRNRGARWFLALETDPNWPDFQKTVDRILTPEAVVAQGNGLILYTLDPKSTRQ
jgi:hypothetical protein